MTSFFTWACHRKFRIWKTANNRFYDQDNIINIENKNKTICYVIVVWPVYKNKLYYDITYTSIAKTSIYYQSIALQSVPFAPILNHVHLVLKLGT